MSTDDSDVVDFSKMKVAELREECENRGLDSSGKKAELVSRLQANATGIYDKLIERPVPKKGWAN